MFNARNQAERRGMFFTALRSSKVDPLQKGTKDLELLAVLEEFEFPGCPPTPFFLLTDRLLSIVANSATCEWLFSVFGTMLTKLRNRIGTTMLSSLAELKMHIRSEHQEKSTKTQMKHMFECRSKPAPLSTTSLSQLPSSNSNPGDSEIDIDEVIWSTSNTSAPGLRDLIPDEITDDGTSIAGPNASISLEDLFNFSVGHWLNLYGESADRYLAEELELCELLSRDAATEGGAEIDVDEMTGDILTG